MRTGQRQIGQRQVGQRQAQRRPQRFLGEALAALLVIVLVALVGPAQATPLDEAMTRVLTLRSADVDDRFLGSAFLWGDGRVAVTNAHVVGLAEEVRMVDRVGIEAVALVIARDSVRDVAVIAVPASFADGRMGLPLATDAPRLGDEVFALGAPWGLSSA
ncbi:MAG: trypsin-like peptidase domain-containing protein [Rhodobacteraceae bacterium]|nr:trypsin-like peptidase domain-containing protein [Paracoccaceae bacterium]